MSVAVQRAKAHIEIQWNPDFFGYCWSLFCRTKSKEGTQN